MRQFILPALLAMLSGGAALAQRVQLTLDSSEAQAALAILAKESAHADVGPSNWSALFATRPYQSLKLREASVNSSFTDEAVKQFLSSEAVIAQTSRLAQTLQRWQSVDLAALGERVLPYLPAAARIEAKVYPEIKPDANSFIWGPENERAIFIYLDPSLTPQQLENKIAHEAHHIGIESLNRLQEAMLAGLPEAQQKAIRWLGGFGEGEAMLAAAGSPQVHPHALDDAAARAEWDQGTSRFNQDLAAVQKFLLEILDGRLSDSRRIQQRAEPFYGQQGAWYTVGYKMASLVEQRFGRAALAGAMLDPRKLLELYNQAAAQDPGLAQWSPELLSKLNSQKSSSQ